MRLSRRYRQFHLNRVELLREECDRGHRTASKTIAKSHRFWFDPVMKPVAAIMNRIPALAVGIACGMALFSPQPATMIGDGEPLKKQDL